VPALCDAVRTELRAGEVREDYVELVEPSTLEPLQRADQGDARLLVAGFVGKTRLIDNTAIGC
jgi:pantoate--beta-alanine ligase